MRTPLKSGRKGFASLFLAGILLALLFSAKEGATRMCIRLKTDTGGERSLPVKFNGHMRLSFRHSIYASQVDEVFSLRPGGFELSQLRYAERRLAEFYGHENARLEDGVWIVNPAPTLFSSLNLRGGADAAMSVHTGQHPDSQSYIIESDGSVRLTVASCERSAND